VIYLDNSATTAIAPEVLEAMLPYLQVEYGNASSVHSLGSKARVALEEARETIARFINAEPREIVFTSGGSESNNAAIKGTLFHAALSNKALSDLHAITSPVEHHAVLEPLEWMSKFGVSISYAPVDEFGRVIVPAAQELFYTKTTLASFMMVNNETGTINPIRDLAEAIKGNSNAIFHSDAVQALGKVKIDVKDLGVDLLSLSAHKIHGPKGIGALYIKSGTPWEPFIHGGSQERNRRGGTEATALAIGFAKAVELLSGHKTELHILHGYLLSRLQAVSGVILNSATGDASVNEIVNFSFTPEILGQLDADALIIRFDMEGIAVSNGAACTSGSQQPSHVLLALGKSRDIATKSIRVSLSRYNTLSDIDRFIEALRRIIPQDQ